MGQCHLASQKWSHLENLEVLLIQKYLHEPEYMMAWGLDAGCCLICKEPYFHP